MSRLASCCQTQIDCLMPRKVDPHLNERTDALPTDYVELVHLPDAVLELFPDIMDDDDKYDAVFEVRAAIAAYAWDTQAGPHRYSRAEARRSLQVILNASEISQATVEALNERAYQLLYDFADPPTQMWMLIAPNGNVPIQGLKKSAEAAIEFLKPQRGPDTSIPLTVLVAELCLIYECVFGEPATHHTKGKDLGYTQVAQSEAGRFVWSIISLAFSEVRRTDVNNCLRGFVEDRRKKM